MAEEEQVPSDAIPSQDSLFTEQTYRVEGDKHFWESYFSKGGARAHNDPCVTVSTFRRSDLTDLNFTISFSRFELRAAYYGHDRASEVCLQLKLFQFVQTMFTPRAHILKDEECLKSSQFKTTSDARFQFGEKLRKSAAALNSEHQKASNYPM